MFLTAQSCVLLPPTSEEDVVQAELQIVNSGATPATFEVARLGRAFNRNQPFSVRNALLVADGAETPNVFWYVAYSDRPTEKQDIRGLDFTLEGCEARINQGVGQQTHLVEALITYGEVGVFGSNADQRVTLGGEPIEIVTWAVEVFGEPDCPQ
ncbi:MAG: hypothetical protein ACI9OJ_005213 [Myxococcota bacterium]|jgi:hypothetical protein